MKPCYTTGDFLINKHASCDRKLITGPLLSHWGHPLTEGVVGQEVGGEGRPVPQHEWEGPSVEPPGPLLPEDLQQAVHRASVLGQGHAGAPSGGLRLALQAHFNDVTWRHHNYLEGPIRESIKIGP